jgi:hypothetical protein
LVGKLESGLMRSPWLWPQTLNLSSRVVEAITWSTSTSSGCTVVIGVGSCLWVGYANARFRFSPVTFFSICWLALSVFPGWSSPFRSFHCGSFALCQWRVVSEHLARLVIQLNWFFLLGLSELVHVTLHMWKKKLRQFSIGIPSCDMKIVTMTSGGPRCLSENGDRIRALAVCQSLLIKMVKCRTDAFTLNEGEGICCWHRHIASLRPTCDSLLQREL